MVGCSPLMKIIAKVSMFISALAAIHMGLMEIGYNALDVLRLGEYTKPLGYIIGLAGLISLIMLCMWCMKHNCTCDTKGSCSCGCR